MDDGLREPGLLSTLVAIQLVWLALGALGLSAILRRCGYPWRAAFTAGPLVKSASWPVGLACGVFCILLTSGVFHMVAAVLGGFLAAAAVATLIEAALLQRSLHPDWSRPGVTPAFWLNLTLAAPALPTAGLLFVAWAFSGYVD